MSAASARRRPPAVGYTYCLCSALYVVSGQVERYVITSGRAEPTGGIGMYVTNVHPSNRSVRTHVADRIYDYSDERLRMPGQQGRGSVLPRFDLPVDCIAGTTCWD